MPAAAVKRQPCERCSAASADNSMRSFGSCSANALVTCGPHSIARRRRRNLGHVCADSIEHDRIDPIEPAAWLAQRPGGQQPTVTQPAVVEQRDFHVARQLQMLQAIVGDDHVALGMRCAQQPRRLGAPLRDRQRRGGCAHDQQRLIADLPRGVFLRAPGAARYRRAPYPRDTMPGRQPRAISARTSSTVSGVLPVPPT